ncbi:unnamed protein product [Paramecium pentaurelia]|uniref:PX domain-containing protein n=1 Tax=Paramecium pentaurelia TaxID=43138 RepID=A0A8S1T756_9CILI|nr:unnamed protein product [Paramecium pentaurelia]
MDQQSEPNTQEQIINQKEIQQQISPQTDIQQEAIKEIEYPDFQISIQIEDAIVKDVGFGQKFTVYLIKGSDNQGSFEIYRRYNDFYELRELLVKKWPGCYIPPIPEKALASGNDNETVQIRKRLMEVFLIAITQLPYIYYSEDFQQQFLRSNSPDIAKVYQQQKTITTSEIIDRLKIAFPKLDVRDQSNSEYMLAITTFSGQLRKSLAILKTYIEQANLVAQQRRILQDEKMNLFNASLPFYEKIILNEYVYGKEQQLVLSNPQNQEDYKKLLEDIKESNKKINSINYLTDMFRYELKDAESMQQTLNYRDQIIIIRAKQEQKMREDQAELAKMTAKQQTLTTITNSAFNKSKDASQIKVEQRISEGQQEIDRLSNLYNIITAIIATKEIEKYRKARVNHYHKFLKTIQQSETKLYQIENQFLEKVIQHSQNQLQSSKQEQKLEQQQQINQEQHQQQQQQELPDQEQPK